MNETKTIATVFVYPKCQRPAIRWADLDNETCGACERRGPKRA